MFSRIRDRIAKLEEQILPKRRVFVFFRVGGILSGLVPPFLRRWIRSLPQAAERRGRSSE
jgi:hypothetical protein